jgi:hypothetical protein
MLSIFFRTCAIALVLLIPRGLPEEKFVYLDRVGIVEVSEGDTGCLTIPTSTLQSGDDIAIVRLQNPQSYFLSHVRAKLASRCSRDPDEDPNASTYSIELAQGRIQAGEVGIGITKFKGPFRILDGLVRGDLEKNGVPDSFRVGTSMEGLHLTVWHGEPLNSPLRWHEYYYLGYDVVPSCTNADAPSEAGSSFSSVR